MLESTLNNQSTIKYVPILIWQHSAIHSGVLSKSYHNLYHEPTLTRYKAVQHQLIKPTILRDNMSTTDYAKMVHSNGLYTGRTAWNSSSEKYTFDGEAKMCLRCRFLQFWVKYFAYVYQNFIKTAIWSAIETSN